MHHSNINQNFFSTVVISDLHIGSKFSHVKKATAFLKSVSCERLILNGDIIDGWQIIKQLRSWNKDFTAFFEEIIRKAQEEKTEIIYLMGNHDDFFLNIAPLAYEKIQILKSYIFSDAQNRKYYVCHGDKLDNTAVKRRWLAKLGDTWYHYMLHLNKFYNHYRKFMNKEPRSFSMIMKTWAKSFFSDGSKLTRKLLELAKVEKVDGIITAHTHIPKNTYLEDIIYLNAGDWIESLTALVQNEDGEWLLWNDKTKIYNSTI